MIPNPCIEVQTSPVDRFSVPPWFAEVVVIVQHLATNGLLDAFAHQVCLVRGRFGSYEPIDFLALLIGYAISGERTLADFFERVEPFEAAFMALFGRNCLPHRHGNVGLVSCLQVSSSLLAMVFQGTICHAVFVGAGWNIRLCIATLSQGS